MATKPVILLDDGGVMNDNRLRGEQWPPLVGEFLSPRLGGTLSTWATANRSIIQQILDPTNWSQRIQRSLNYPDFEYTYLLDWLRGMAHYVGVALPSEQECFQLAQQAERYVIPRVRSAFPGVCETILQLHTKGYLLHTASGESSIHLDLYLEGMGVRQCFGRLYGSDLLNTFKEGPAYYERLFSDLQIEPCDTVIVDDSPRALSWAREFGAHTIQVGGTGKPDNGTWHMSSLAELPTLLRG